MGLLFVPILEGKMVAWKNWMATMNGTRHAELKEMNQRYNLTQHTSWLVKTENGYAAVVIIEGPGEKDFYKHLSASHHPFDKWFKEKIQEMHGVEAGELPGESIKKSLGS